MSRLAWLRRAQLVGLGAIGALALPPFHLVFMLLPAITGLIWILDQTDDRRCAFGIGWSFGLGQGLVGYYWVSSAFLVDTVAHGVLAPFAVAGLAGCLAIFPAATASIAWSLWRWWGPSPLARILTFAGLWAASEWLRADILTGFPWNLVATVWTFSPEMLQAAALVGPYGLGMITIAVAGLPAIFLFGNNRRVAMMGLGVGLLVLADVWVLGYLRLGLAPPSAVDGVRLRLVQPNIKQHLKWRHELRVEHVRQQMRLSDGADAAGAWPTHVIWAETAVPFNLSADVGLRQVMASAVPADGLLITGAPRGETIEGGERRVYNSIHALDPKGEITATYDKRHLVPFGEYVPLRWLFGFSKLTAGRLDFHPGTTSRVFDLAGLPPAVMLICYEIIFPAKVGVVHRRPAWMLNLTNDAWFGLTTGPHQHLAAAQMRAVEQGLPVVRVANTGISAVIDAHGRIEARLGLGQGGRLDTTLPKALAGPPPYGRYGDWLTLIMIALGLAAIWLPRLAPGREHR